MQSEKDLPSPILKNNIEGLQSGLLSPNDIKSSSPLLSPSSSSENINSLGKYFKNYYYLLFIYINSQNYKL